MSDREWGEPKKEHRPMGDSVDAWNALERKVKLNEKRKELGLPAVYLSDHATRVAIISMVEGDKPKI